MELGNKISELRKKFNFSQEQLAEKLNVTRQTISNWELGQTVPDILQAKEMSKIFNVTLDELIDNDMKDILVEKINHTQDMTNTIIKTLKALCVLIVFFLIMVIIINTVLLIKGNINRQKIDQESTAEQKIYQEYMKNAKIKQFYININDEKYSYQIQYGEDGAIIGDIFALIKSSNENKSESYETYFNDIFNSSKSYDNANEKIKDLKQYFEEKGGIWEEAQI